MKTMTREYFAGLLFGLGYSESVIIDWLKKGGDFDAVFLNWKKKITTK